MQMECGKMIMLEKQGLVMLGQLSSHTNGENIPLAKPSNGTRVLSLWVRTGEQWTQRSPQVVCSQTQLKRIKAFWHLISDFHFFFFFFKGMIFKKAHYSRAPMGLLVPLATFRLHCQLLCIRCHQAAQGAVAAAARFAARQCWHCSFPPGGFLP